MQFEVRGDGAQFSNITEDPNPLYIGLVMIAVDIVLYFLLTLYFDRVIPSMFILLFIQFIQILINTKKHPIYL